MVEFNINLRFAFQVRDIFFQTKVNFNKIYKFIDNEYSVMYL